MSSESMYEFSLFWVCMFGGLAVYIMVAPLVYIAYLVVKRIVFVVGLLLYYRFGWFRGYYGRYY